MPRPRKHKIAVEQVESLQSIMQEVYNDAHGQMKEATDAINILVNSTTPEDVDDTATITKERGNLMKLKDSAIKIKLDVAKLHAEIIKNNGKTDGVAESFSSTNTGSIDDALKATRALIRQNGQDNEED
jgi:hypothetical protein|tara:strand:+ start:8102 stop:8488 length:387 start_codon:yes stop_codon:yes gene_type:complete